MGKHYSTLFRYGYETWHVAIICRLVCQSPVRGYCTMITLVKSWDSISPSQKETNSRVGFFLPIFLPSDDRKLSEYIILMMTYCDLVCGIIRPSTQALTLSKRKYEGSK